MSPAAHLTKWIKPNVTWPPACSSFHISWQIHERWHDQRGSRWVNEGHDWCVEESVMMDWRGKCRSDSGSDTQRCCSPRAHKRERNRKNKIEDWVFRWGRAQKWTLCHMRYWIYKFPFFLKLRCFIKDETLLHWLSQEATSGIHIVY